MIQFSIKDLMWSTAIVGVGICWLGSCIALRRESVKRNVLESQLRVERQNTAMARSQYLSEVKRSNRLYEESVELQKNRAKENAALHEKYRAEVSERDFYNYRQIDVLKKKHQQESEEKLGLAKPKDLTPTPVEPREWDYRALNDEVLKERYGNKE